MVDVKGTTVLYPNETFFLTALPWAPSEADGPFYFSLIYRRMIAIQPSWKIRIAPIMVWTLSRHSYSWNVQETIPTSVEVVITFSLIIAVTYGSIIIVQDSVELAYIS